MTAPTADGFVTAVRQARSAAELPAIRKRCGPDDEAFGIRMRDLFAAAKDAALMPLTEVDTLLDNPLYEARMGAWCILDFQARAATADAVARDRLAGIYLRRHDRITTWDMVDRAAPSVLGGALLGRDTGPLRVLAESPDPLRRRSAVTAPLWFVRYADPATLTDGFDVAALLADDPDPVVHRAVGTFLKHAGGRDPAATVTFLQRHAARMARSTISAATSKLSSTDRARLGR